MLCSCQRCTAACLSAWSLACALHKADINQYMLNLFPEKKTGKIRVLPQLRPELSDQAVCILASSFAWQLRLRRIEFTGEDSADGNHGSHLGIASFRG